MKAHTFRAMGSPCRIVVDGGSDDLAADAHDLIARLEQRWSRFLPSSEISHVNGNAGNVTVVSEQTFGLMSRAVEAQALTGGRFNPLMLLQLTALGYDAPWQQRVDGVTSGRPAGDQPRPASTEPIDLFPEINAVRIPEATAFDPGGIGKGFAADLVTHFLIEQGATCSSVELGGDVRVSGEPWFDTSWRIGVANPFDDSADIAAFSPLGGAVATSSRLRRSWIVENEQRHHLLDPSTGQPALTDLVSATACSSVAWWAEVAAKVALIEGSSGAIDLLQEFGTPGLVVAADGSVQTTAPEARVGKAKEVVNQ